MNWLLDLFFSSLWASIGGPVLLLILAGLIVFAPVPAWLKQLSATPLLIAAAVWFAVGIVDRNATERCERRVRAVMAEQARENTKALSALREQLAAADIAQANTDAELSSLALRLAARSRAACLNTQEDADAINGR